MCIPGYFYDGLTPRRSGAVAPGLDHVQASDGTSTSSCNRTYLQPTYYRKGLSAVAIAQLAIVTSAF